MKKILVLVLIILVKTTSIYPQQEINTDYVMDEISPDSIPLVFEKGIVSSQFFEHSSPEFSKDGKNMLWTVVPGEPGSEAFIFSSQKNDMGWSAPEEVTYLGNNDNMYPVFAFDFLRIYFSSSKTIADKQDPIKRSIWYVNKIDNSYSEPIYVGFDFLDIYGLFAAKSGNLYFMAQDLNTTEKYNLYFSQYVDGNYAEPIMLPEPINSEYYEDNPYLSADEDFIIFESSRPGGFGGIDLYFSIRQPDGSWSAPKNIGEPINSTFSDRFPKISNEGNYFFWGSNRNATTTKYDFDIYWISSSIIYNLIKNSQ